MKKIFCVIISLLIVMGTASPAFAAEDLWQRSEPGGNYVTFRLPVPGADELDWRQEDRIFVRYADNGEPVPLTGWVLRGYVFATVPLSESGRKLEVAMGEEKQYPDEMTNWGYDAPLGAERLTNRGVIQGDLRGHLRSKDILTRAEAAAIFSRLLSLEPGNDPGFSDVHPGDWFYNDVSALRAAGLIESGKSFRPRDAITRAEFTVLSYRAMKLVGWMRAPETIDISYLEDAELVPDWAAEAYTVIYNEISAGLFDIDYSGPYGELLSMNAAPEKPVTREEAIEKLDYTLRLVPVYPTEAAIALGFDKEMPVLDGSTSTYQYSRMVYYALFHNAQMHPQFPKAHSKSYPSYQKLISGENDILFVAAPPSEAIVEEAKAAGVELELIPIAYDAMVFFTNGENPTEGLTSEQITAIYTENNVENWKELGGPDAEFIPYCRNLDSGSQALMERYFLGERELNPEILSETVSRAMESIITDVYGAGRTDPPAYALGYSIYYYYMASRWLLLPSENSLKLLAIDGVLPSEETIRDGSYPLADYNYVVLRKDSPADSPARKMAEFMLTPEGQSCVSNAGYGPIITE